MTFIITKGISPLIQTSFIASYEDFFTIISFKTSACALKWMDERVTVQASEVTREDLHASF